MKTFGKRRQAAQIVQEDFTLIVERNGKFEDHVFTARPKVSAGDMMNTALAEKDQALGVTAYRNIIRKSLVDDDGVAARWRPDPFEPTAQAARVVVNSWSEGDAAGTLVWPAESPEEAAERRVAELAGEEPEDVEYFLGPDDVAYRMDDIEALKKFQDKAAGSSRRRWDYLMDADEDAIVQMDDLQDIVRWMVATASGRPTGR